MHRCFRLNVRWVLLPALLMTIVALLAACGGGGGGGDGTPTAGETTAPATEPPADTSGPSPTAATTPDIGSFCDLVEADEVDEVLGEFVTGIPCGNLNGQWQADSGAYLRMEPGSPDDLQVNATMEGVAGEPVAGIGDGAVWFAGVPMASHHFDFEDTVELGVLSLRHGDVYLLIMLNLPGVDSDAQLDAARDVAALVIPRLP